LNKIWFDKLGVIKIAIVPWVQKITIALLKNGLSLNFTLPNIESAAISNNKTIAAHVWVHWHFPKVLIFGHLQ